MSETDVAGMDVRLLIAALDKEYQSALPEHDPETMDRILAEGFALVTGNGRVWNGTAVVTAPLRARGTRRGRRSSTSYGAAKHT